MTDHNTDTHTTNEDRIGIEGYWFLAIILMLTGKSYGPEVLFPLFQIGLEILLFPFMLAIVLLLLGCLLALASVGILILYLAITEPVVGAFFAGVNITMIAMHCPFGLVLLPFSCCGAVLIVFLLYSIGQLCQTSYYQRKAVVREAVVVHRFTTEENNNDNNSASSLVNYYWVGEYEAPSSPRYVTPNNGDEKRTTSIQLFHNNGNQQQGAVEKNGLEECSCTEEEEEEVCYNIQQQRFHKKFLVTVDLYDAASLEVSVLPGRPNSAMLTKSFKHSPLELMLLSCFMIVFVVGFYRFSVVWPLQMIFGFFGNSKDKNGLDDDDVCSGWQTSLPYITSVVMVMLAMSNNYYNEWKEYQKREFAAVTVHNPTGGEQELVTVVGPQNKKEEDEYHHHINDDGDDKTETETACTSRELDNDDETTCTRELDNDDDTTYIREPLGTGRNGAFLV